MMRWVIVVCVTVVVAGRGFTDSVWAQCEDVADVIVIEALVDNPTPYVGEQVIYSTRIFNTTQSSPSLEMPPFEGFWSAGALAIETYNRPGDCGITVGVTENDRILFPLRTGELNIPPVQLDFSRNPVYEASTRVDSNELVVDVQPLPEGAPDGYNGAVGYPFFINADVGRNTAKAGDPISLRVVIEGAGNIEQMNPPTLPFPMTWRTYEQPTTVETAAEGRLFVGKKTFEWLVVPDETGEVIIPPFAFHYFDTNSDIYRTVRTDPIILSILPADDVPVANVPNIAPEVESGLLALKPLTAGGGGVRVPGVWLLWLIAPMVFVGSVWWRWYETRTSEEKVAQRRQQAIRTAKNNLAQVTRRSGDQAYRRLITAILTYFADKWNQEPLSLQQEDLRVGMEQRGVEQETIEQVLQCLKAAEEGRYAPEGDSPSRSLVKQTLMALIAVESAMERR